MDILIEGMMWGLGKAAGLWLIFWSIRRRGEFDEKLDSYAQGLRWSLVLGSFALLTQFPRFGYPRATLLLIGLAFLCWPNFAFHLSNVLRKLGLFPAISSTPVK